MIRGLFDKELKEKQVYHTEILEKFGIKRNGSLANLSHLIEPENKKIKI